MKKIFTLLLCVFIITGLIGCSGSGSSKTSTQTASSEGTATTSTEKLSDIANDSYIIYNYSYNDAVAQNGQSSKTITVKNTDNGNYYNFVDHVLSCGTYMNGQIIETTNDNIKTITGSFTVTKNPYKITDLKVSITIDTNTNTKTGYILANGQPTDINSNFTAIK